MNTRNPIVKKIAIRHRAARTAYKGGNRIEMILAYQGLEGIDHLMNCDSLTNGKHLYKYSVAHDALKSILNDKIS